MEENKDKKTENSSKLQLKKTFNVGQIKQSFSHGRTRSVSVEIKKKRVLRGFNDKPDLPKNIFKEEDDSQKESKNQIVDTLVIARDKYGFMHISAARFSIQKRFWGSLSMHDRLLSP